MIPAVTVGLIYAISDHARRAPGEPWDLVGLLGLIAFFTAVVVGACVMGRRFADMGRSPLEVKLVGLLAIVVSSIINAIDRPSAMGHLLGACIILAVLVAVGLPKGVPEDRGYGPDPRMSRRRDI
jgi:uncharacterized membrane protein YhaH (DUF805 family)